MKVCMLFMPSNQGLHTKTNTRTEARILSNSAGEIDLESTLLLKECFHVTIR